MTDSAGLPAEGDLAPDFQLVTDEGKDVRLSDFRGKKVVLFFYPRADTPGCTKEACEFRDRNDAFTEKDAVILGISPDPVSALEKFRSKFDLPFSLLSDSEHTVAELYGVWKEKSMYGKTFWGVERSTFVIDQEGKIVSARRKVRPAGHAEDMLNEI